MKRFSIVCVAIAMLVSCNAKDKTTETKVQEQQVPTTKVVEITQAQFAELVSDYTGEWQMKSDVPVIVDFNATWCGPCRMLAPIMEELSEENQSIKFAKLDVDEVSQVASRYMIASIPTLLFFKDGTLVETQIGFSSKEALEAKFKELF